MTKVNVLKKRPREIKTCGIRRSLTMEVPSADTKSTSTWSLQPLELLKICSHDL